MDSTMSKKEQVRTSDVEKFVRCRCCGGLCTGHSKIAKKSTKEPEDDDVSGCWECCGAGCRACGNSGKISLELAVATSDRRVEKLIKKVKDAKNELEEERMYNEILFDWENGGPPSKDSV